MTDLKSIKDIKVKIEDVKPNKENIVKSKKLSSDIKIGKSILELLTTAMYASPMTIYREYVQNAVDSIDLADVENLFSKPNSEPRIDLLIDRQLRSVIIRDTGTAIKQKDFEKILTAFGDSPKRKMKARGFRGIGRLAGLAYCKELIFRSKTADELFVNELRWDCLKLRQLLVDSDDDMALNDIVRDITTINSVEHDPSKPDRYFEVRLNGVQPIKNDILLNVPLIENYISQVCPVPFKNSFKYKNEITNWLADASYSEYKIYINNSDQHITRPYSVNFNLSKDKTDDFSKVELIDLKTNQDVTIAKGFILHHSYLGAINDSTISGVKVRSGNIQVGGNDIFRALFKQERFNAWCVGEFHIIDSKIKANGRRDGFEHNKNYYSFLDYIKATTSTLSKIIEDTSRERNKLKVKENIHKFVSKKDKAVNSLEEIMINRKVKKNVIKEILDFIKKEI